MKDVFRALHTAWHDRIDSIVTQDVVFQRSQAKTSEYVTHAPSTQTVSLDATDKDGDANDVFKIVEAWSRSPLTAMDIAKTIINNVTDDSNKISIAGFAVLRIRLDDQQELQDYDPEAGDMYGQRLRFRISAYPTT